MPARSKYYYFLDGDLHKQLRVNTGKDLLTAWNFPERKKVILNYTWVKLHKKKAFTTKEAAAFMNRSWISLAKAMGSDQIKEPQYSYSLETGRKKEYWWSEEDIMGLLEYYSSLSKGRPRKDGELTSWNLPTPRELRALINDEEVLYVKKSDGTFAPTWRARN